MKSSYYIRINAITPNLNNYCLQKTNIDKDNKRLSYLKAYFLDVLFIV